MVVTYVIIHCYYRYYHYLHSGCTAPYQMCVRVCVCLFVSVSVCVCSGHACVGVHVRIPICACARAWHFTKVRQLTLSSSGHADANLVLWSLGKLTLLTGPHNSRIQNSEFAIKVEKLRDRALVFVGASLVYTGAHNSSVVFTPENCEQRGETMLK